MIINKLTIINTEKGIRISAKIDFNTKGKQGEVLWFDIPEKYKDKISSRSDAFLSCLFLLAMSLGEDIRVEGEVSPRLLENINRYQKIYNTWLPDDYSVVSIEARDVLSDSGNGQAVISAFSGGVDSFHTLFENLFENIQNKSLAITHGIYVHGFDIALDQTKTFSVSSKMYNELFQSLGLELITLSTNIKDILDKELSWDWTHGAALAGTALLFSPMAKCLYIPSSYTNDTQVPHGSHRETDPLISTESFATVYYGAHHNRQQKIEIVSTWPASFNRLRVCTWPREEILNCCRCNKCIKAMMSLEALNKLQNYKESFPLPLTKKLMSNIPVIYGDSREFWAGEFSDYLIALGRSDMADYIKISLKKNRLRSEIISKLNNIKFGRKILGSGLVKKIYHCLTKK